MLDNDFSEIVDTLICNPQSFPSIIDFHSKCSNGIFSFFVLSSICWIVEEGIDLEIINNLLDFIEDITCFVQIT